MLLIETAIFYVLIGAGTAVAVFLRDDAGSPAVRAARVVGACLFWPLFVPLLLSPSTQESIPFDRSNAKSASTAPPPDELAAAIGQVEKELDAALLSLDGWAENVLALEQDRLLELRAAWRQQAERIREIDRLLAQPQQETDLLSKTAAENDRVRHSVQVRQENLQRLETLRQQMHAEFAGTLAWVREVATMIHVAKFTGAPASRAEELVAQLAAVVEGLSEASSWNAEPELAAR